MNNHDNLIAKVIFPKTRISRHFILNKERYPNILKYLSNRYFDSSSINETINRIKHHIEIRPVCKECGKEVAYKGNGIYSTYCSSSCSFKNTNQERIKTNLCKYGVVNPAKNEKIKSKAIQTSLDRYGVTNGGWSKESQEKIKKTNLQHYGVEMPLQSKFIYDKTVKTQQKKYGVSNYMKSNDFVKKSKQTNLDRYGVVHPMKNNDVAYKLKQKLNTEEIRNKVINTKRKNHTFNTSKPEEILYRKLVDKYGVDDVIRQYKSDVYPFACDFYIKSKDLYIEFQGMWTHGKHAFNLDSEEDKLILEQWKEKAKTSKFYKNAIETWTVRDVKKRETANKNNLNYIEIWDVEKEEA